MIDPRLGLTSQQVADRVAAGQVNHAPDARSRSLADIVRANTFTWFNALIGGMWVVMLFIAPIQDSLFGFVIVFNTLIGIVQEYRAARTLARLSLLHAARPLVRRDGTDAALLPDQIVADDVIVLNPGDQLVVDGVLLACDGLEVDESLLTGEADPVDKAVGDEVLSGSFVAAGSGVFQATRIGADAYAAGLAVEAKKFVLTNSELRDAINRFIRTISFLLLPVGALLLWSQMRVADLTVQEALRGTIAGMVTMVPEGLVLLTSIAMAVAVLRLASRRVLVQDMPAVEVLARVDTVCVDKTGTLTEPGMRLQDVLPVSDVDPLPALGALARLENAPNPTLQAIADGTADPGWQASARVPFSSARKWSSGTFDGQGAWVLGAPEVVLPADHPVRAQADELARHGSRVLVVGRADGEPSADAGCGAVLPAALVTIAQQLRGDAADTVRYFLDQDVRVKVISGDNAETVGAIAALAGVPGADEPIDARELPSDVEQLGEVVASHGVFGRVTPVQKQSFVDALHGRGSTVAMTGDGVNDVLALKRADLGIAMGSGSGATRAVAQLVLLDDQWSVMPSVVAEGRRVLGNIERVSDVFLTKSFYAMTISLSTGLFGVAFPFLPRHLSLIGALTIGIPGFFLALMPNTERFRPGFFRRVLLFAVPAGLIAALCAFTSYGVTLRVGEPMSAARSAATVTLFIVTSAVLLQSARPLNAIRLAIVGSMVAMFLAVLYVPFLSDFFALSLRPERYSVVAVVVGLLGALAVWGATVITDRWRRPDSPGVHPNALR